MSEYSKLNTKKQLAKPAEVFPEFVEELAKSAAIARLQSDSLSVENVAKNLGVTKQSFNRRVKKWVEILGGTNE